MRTVAIEEHAAVPEVFDVTPPAVRAAGSDRPWRQAMLNDLGEGRLAAMDESGIDVQVLSLQPGLDWARPEKARVAVQRFNAAIAATIAAHPTRFAGFATLPMDDGAAAAQTLRHAVEELGLHGAQVSANIEGVGFIEDEAHWPIFEAAEALGVPVYIHPGLPPKAVYEAYYADLGDALGLVMASAAWGWHVDTGLHALRLIVKGAFDRFPKLQVIIGHMGEGIPFMLGRLNERFGLIHESIPGFASPMQRPFRDYFRENIHISTSGMFDDDPLLCSIGALGADRIMFAVDYPFSRNAEGRRFLDEAPVSDADRELIAHGNADRLLGLAP